MRLRGIGPEVLLLCFLVVATAAFLLGRRTTRGRRLRRDLDYFQGLDHLVNDRFDRATEVFTRLATKSHDADIQFALGSVMRKRGEVDRAIAIHTELMQHREAPIRERATLALGLDYMSAGLFDRAEEKLRNLLGSSTYRGAVLEKLAWVYEQQRDWRAALDNWRELPAELQRERAGVAAHYCCELGEVALAAGDLAGARTQLAAARVHDPSSARAAILAARIAAATGEMDKALDLYVAAFSASRSVTDGFIAEARAALGERARELDARLAAHPPEDDSAARSPAPYRCDQCGVASITWHWRCPSCRSYDSLQSVHNQGN
jgi:lipopolysaccharide biosynthesis regulator YciM